MFMGLSRDQAAHLLGLGWRKDALTTLHQCLKDYHDFMEAFHDPWGFHTEAGRILYRSFTPADIRRAFTALPHPNFEWEAFADGSGTTSEKPAGIGVVLYAPRRAPELFAENIGPGTNNRAELCAIWRALRAVPHRLQPLLVRSDSEYAIGALTQDWARNANARLIENIRRDLERRPNVRFEHVDGHAGVEGNEVADRLAKVGRKLVTNVSVYEG